MLYEAYQILINMDKNNLYTAEAKQRWGHTLAYKQSTARVAKMSKEDMAKIQAESDSLLKEIVASMSKGPKSSEIQKLIAHHYANLHPHALHYSHSQCIKRPPIPGSFFAYR